MDRAASGIRAEEIFCLFLLAWIFIALVGTQWALVIEGPVAEGPVSPVDPADVASGFENPGSGEARGAAPAWVGALGFLSLGLCFGFVSRAFGGRRTDPEPRRPPAAAPHVLVETFLLFILLSLALGVWLGSLMGPGNASETGTLWPLWLQWSLALVFLWPLGRGFSVPDLGRAVAWPVGSPSSRFWGDVVWGLAAYVASWPILALAAGLSVWISQHWASGRHPVADLLLEAQGFDLLTLWIIALVWAPLMEELVFRGVFFSYLWARWSPWVATVGSASFFAVLHPQGVAGWPFLFTLGAVFAAARYVRGSIVPCMTMHCIHNGVTLTVLTKWMS